MTSSVHRPTSGSAGPFDAVLVDLDGTITDSAPAILSSFKAALTELGIPYGSRDELMRLVGPPLSEGFRLFAGLTGEANANAVAVYRRHYRELMLDSPVYDGMAELLRSLHGQGVPIGLATSKRESMAVQILEHAGLLPLFTVTAGAEDADQHGAKEDVIRTALERLRAAGAPTGRVVHVGDRAHDVDGAHEAGVECVAALWGYGDEAELAGAEHLARDTSELASLLGGETE